MRSSRLTTSLLSLALLCSSSALAQSTASDQDLRKDIEELKRGQAAIQKDLQDIKRLLQPAAAAVDALPTQPVNISREPSKGDASAKVALIEYSDYQCGFCGRYDRDTYPQILTEYVNTGKVRYVFRDLPLDFHKNAFKAAEAAHCAGEQGKFWEMHDRLFANQSALEVPELAKHASALQLDAKRFQQCLEVSRYASDIRRDITEANGAGLSGTPSFLIGIVQPDATVKVSRRIIGAKPYAEFKAAIDSLLSANGRGSQ